MDILLYYIYLISSNFIVIIVFLSSDIKFA